MEKDIKEITLGNRMGRFYHKFGGQFAWVDNAKLVQKISMRNVYFIQICRRIQTPQMY